MTLAAACFTISTIFPFWRDFPVSQTLKTHSPVATLSGADAAHSALPPAEFLCVDLDGTLTRSDTLWESLLALLGRHPWAAFLIPLWLLRGKAAFKQEIARRADLNARTLPLRDDFVEFLKLEKSKGRKRILVTAADRSIATAVSDRLGIFDAVLASDGKTNLSGTRKKAAIETFLGGAPFDYAANNGVDLPVWAVAQAAVLVGASPKLVERARRTVNVAAVFEPDENKWRAVAAAMRPRHWVKNLLVFVPLVMAHQIRDPLRLIEALLAFAGFSLCASGIYILNDLFDLESDRLHHSKRSRPFASGDLSLGVGVILAPALVAAGWIAAAALSPLFLGVLVVYAASAFLYSAYGKRVPMVDVLLLTGLYLLRILGGGAATDVPVSPWLLAFSMFLLLSLALAKRYVELAGQDAESDAPRSSSKRNYHPNDADLVRQFGVASGYISVLVLALYVNGREVTSLYNHPQWIWLACPLLLFWISRVWFLANRGQLHDDPVVFAVRDSASYVLGLIILAILFAAS